MPIVVMGSRLLFNDGTDWSDTINKPSGARPLNGYCASVIKVMLCITIKRIFNNEKCICELKKSARNKTANSACAFYIYNLSSKSLLRTARNQLFRQLFSLRLSYSLSFPFSLLSTSPIEKEL